MTDEERKAQKREYNAAHREERKRYYLEHRDHYLRLMKIRNLKVMQDPDLYARLMEQRHRPEKMAAARARAKKWREQHRRRAKANSRASWSRIRYRAATDPDFYAHLRAYWRETSRKYRMKKNPFAKRRGPAHSRRIPNYCVFGRVLDTRSVFLWNNLPAASLVAGRAYRAMQWREIHCDRYGQVCR